MKVGDVVINKITGERYYYLSQGGKNVRIGSKATLFFHSVNGGNDFLIITRAQLATDYKLAGSNLRQPQLID